MTARRGIWSRGRLEGWVVDPERGDIEIWRGDQRPGVRRGQAKMMMEKELDIRHAPLRYGKFEAMLRYKGAMVRGRVDEAGVTRGGMAVSRW